MIMTVSPLLKETGVTLVLRPVVARITDSVDLGPWDHNVTPSLDSALAQVITTALPATSDSNVTPTPTLAVVPPLPTVRTHTTDSNVFLMENAAARAILTVKELMVARNAACQVKDVFVMETLLAELLKTEINVMSPPPASGRVNVHVLITLTAQEICMDPPVTLL